MKKPNNKLIDKVVASLDWDSIFEVSKCFKHGIGEGTSAIPGVKRKPFSDGITKADLKNELKSLLKYIIENDISDLAHGYWIITWNNAEWSEEHINDIKRRIEEEAETEDGEKFNLIWEEFEMESTLEVIYSPQRICVVENTKKDSSSEVNEEGDTATLENMLEKALQNEQYELASKIKDVLSLQKREGKLDK